MQGDLFNYRQARSISLIGLLLQVLMTIGLGIYTAFSGAATIETAASSGDHAALTATLYAALGIPVWITLAFLFDWHRRDRAEQLEVDRMSADPSSSAFDDADDSIRVAARRLAGIQKFGLPIVSLSLGFSLITIGFVRLAQGRARFAEEVLEPMSHGGWALVVGLGIAFCGFIFARFVSGMAKQPVWAALRAGASYAVGTALLGLAMAFARFVELASGPEEVLYGLQVAFPIFLIIMGVEVFLNFVLDLYRPRKPGEDPRAAFDSRVLGLLAAPDKIAENIGEALNYQFGIEVSKTWFYLLLRRWWPAFLMIIVVVMWSMTALVVIEPHQKALILTFGKPAERADGGYAVAEPGLHVKWPWPIGEVYIPAGVDAGGEGGVPTVTGVRAMTLGTNSPADRDEPILWTNDHLDQGVEEYYNLVQPARIERASTGTVSANAVRAELDARDSVDPFGDLSLVAVELPVHWVVGDVAKYDQFAQPDSRARLLQVLGQQIALRYLSAQQIERVLGDGRLAIADEVRAKLEARFSQLNEGEGAGVDLLFVGTGNVHPPQDVAPNFERVVQAQQVRESKIEAAREFAIQTITRVAPVVTGADGERIDAQQLIERIDDARSLRQSGASKETTAAAEVEIQRLLERGGGEAGSLLIDASAERWRRHMGERGNAALFEGQLAGFEAAPGVYMAERYFDAMAAAMADARVYLVDKEDLGGLNIRLELQSKRQTDVFDPNAGAELQN